MDLTRKIFRISASMFITRTGDEETFIDARCRLRNVALANGFSLSSSRATAAGSAACTLIFRATLGKICRPGY
jgi:hypothetical protein